MPIEALRKKWEARGAYTPLHCMMTFDGDELVLGAETKLAIAESDSPGGGGGSAAKEARVVALLSAAYRRPIASSTLTHIQRALVKQSVGEATLALVHLALAGLPKLASPMDDARRLFMADGLMKEGVNPRTILRALELDESRLDQLERRYNPDQPRVPAGNGRESGQWTSEGAADSSADDTVEPNDRSPDQSSRSNIRLADNSSNWARFLDPIDEAEAATGRPAFKRHGAQ